MDDPTRVLTVFVPGTPAPQGSKRHVGGGVLVESSRSLAGWREAIGYHTRAALASTRHPGYAHHAPVEIIARFYFRRPPSVRRISHVVKPDLDKLERALLDGLVEGGALADDAQVSRLVGSKHYAPPARPTGVLVVVRPRADREP